MTPYTCTIDGHTYQIEEVFGSAKIRAVSVDGVLEADFDKSDHSYWVANPGLRERILQRYRADRLVG